MASKEDMLKVASAVGYDIPDDQLDDYTTLLGRMKGALDTLSAMDGKNFLTVPSTKAILRKTPY